MSLTLTIGTLAAIAVLACGAVYCVYRATRDKGRVGNDASILADCTILKKYIDNFVMVPAFRAHSKHEAMAKLVEIAGQELPELVCNVEHAKQSVFEREESMPTGLDNGIAVPHGRTDGVKQISGVLALVDNSENENGIIPDYDTIDHSKIQILCLILIPNSINTPYLQLLAEFIRILQDTDNRDQLLTCKTSSEMRKFFRSM